MADQALIEALRERVRQRPLPRHVALIMDGNGRWAEARGLPRVAGHREGPEPVRAVTREARRDGVQALTLYALATACAPIAPLAPPRFSTMKDCFSRSLRRWAITRARMSVVPPGG